MLMATEDRPQKPITQELFEEVIGIGYDIYKLDESSNGRYCYYYHYTCPIMGEGSIVNEHISEEDLASQLKEWAHGKGYILDSKHKHCTVLKIEDIQKVQIDFYADTETEAINDASMWVFQQVKKKRFTSGNAK